MKAKSLMAYEDARKPKKSSDHPVERALLGDVSQAANRKSEEAKEQYNYYYNRIYPLLKEGKLDFHRIAEKTGHKERRIRETLLFRLTTGEVMQLFGKKDGFCYICSRRLISMNTKEPMCLNCLQALDTAIQELHLAELHEGTGGSRTLRLERHDSSRGTSDEPEFETLQREFTQAELTYDTIPEAIPDWVPRAQYEVLLHEVTDYRSIYGPLQRKTMDSDEALSTSTTPPPTLSLVQSASAAPAEPPKAPPPTKADAFLDVLNMNDQDVPAAHSDVADIPGLSNHEPLRHFGFQRLKPRT